MAKEKEQNAIVTLNQKIESVKNYLATSEGASHVKEAMTQAQNENKQLREASRVDRRDVRVFQGGSAETVPRVRTGGSRLDPDRDAQAAPALHVRGRREAQAGQCPDRHPHPQGRPGTDREVARETDDEGGHERREGDPGLQRRGGSQGDRSRRRRGGHVRPL